MGTTPPPFPVPPPHLKPSPSPPPPPPRWPSDNRKRPEPATRRTRPSLFSPTSFLMGYLFGESD